MATDIEIARKARLAPISEVAARLDLSSDAVIPYGRGKAKIDIGALGDLKARQKGALVLVTAINPTPAGEGKTTTTVGLGDALNRIGKKTAIVLREPSLGPCFGVKGGATGGGMAQVVPMDDINLHFTGDFSRRHRRPQSSVGDDGQSSLLGKQPRPRPAKDHMAPGHGHE